MSTDDHENPVVPQGPPTTPTQLIYSSDGHWIWASVCCDSQEHTGIVTTTSSIDPSDLGCKEPGPDHIVIAEQSTPSPGFAGSPGPSDFFGDAKAGGSGVEGDKNVIHGSGWEEIFMERFRFKNVGMPLREKTFRLHKIKPVPGGNEVVFFADDCQTDDGGDYDEIQVLQGTLQRSSRMGGGEGNLFRGHFRLDGEVRELFVIFRP